MADGGDPEMSPEEKRQAGIDSLKRAFKTPEPEEMPYAEGGKVHHQDDDMDMVDSIMAKRYSKGGRVANDTSPVADFEDNQFDDLVKDDGLEFSYTGANSGDELGNKREDEDERDVVASVMKSRKKKDRLPNPR